MWILSLKDATTLYNKVQIYIYLHHLFTSNGDLEATDIMQLQLAMLGWWAEDP